MRDYVAPLEEIRFTLNELLDLEGLYQLPAYAAVEPGLTDTILDEAGKFAAGVYSPLNQSGDAQGVRLTEAGVVAADGFAAAYQQFVENGWLTLAQDPEYGGQGLPFTVHMAASEMWHSACTSLALCSLLTAGGIEALSAHASEELKKLYLPKLVSGEWTATMNLTEPHAGSDLSTLKTRAQQVGEEQVGEGPVGDHYLVRGQKIFITWGDHDMSENIIHIVLAPMQDAPEGNAGLSLFLVPKFLVNADGSLGERNDVRVVSTEHKLGIHASPTCVMSFGDGPGAVGYLVGEPGDGLACMFTLMNHARLEVGLQAVAIAERAYQGALAYAKERVQGRDVASGESARIIQHADVQRMLMQMKSITDAMRAMTYDGSLAHDVGGHGADEAGREAAERRFALLTPVIKAWSTELVNEVASLGIQVHGGMGFIEETGAAQHYRDARITAIYEGTNGIQANDLVGRKLLRDKGAELAVYLAEEKNTIADLKASGDEVLARMGAQLEAAVAELEAVSQFVMEEARSHPKFVGAVAFNYLMMLGTVAGAGYMGRSALIAAAKNGQMSADFYEKKLTSGRFYFGHVLPRYKSFGDAVQEGAGPCVALTEASF